MRGLGKIMNHATVKFMDKTLYIREVVYSNRTVIYVSVGQGWKEIATYDPTE